MRENHPTRERRDAASRISRVEATKITKLTIFRQSLLRILHFFHSL